MTRAGQSLTVQINTPVNGFGGDAGVIDSLISLQQTSFP